MVTFFSSMALRLMAASMFSMWLTSTVFAATPAPPPGASSCSGCHPSSARVGSPVPQLVGRPATQIIAAMAAFSTGGQPATVMDRIAKGFTEAEVKAIAEWYAAQK